MTPIDWSDPQIADERRAIGEIAMDIAFAARSNASVLITGAAASEKALIARLIHQRSGRATAPFVTVNCAGVPERELEFELFGHTRDGTGKMRGTILLEAVAGISPRLQGRLFTLLGPDIRFMTATSPDLYASVVAGGFRQDLYYRLNVIHVHVPLLREHLADLTLLVDHFTGSRASDLLPMVPTRECAAPSPGPRIRQRIDPCLQRT